MADDSSAFTWVDGRREWWARAGARRFAKLRRALRECRTDTRALYAYDVVSESVSDGPKGYVVVDPLYHSICISAIQNLNRELVCKQTCD